MTQRVSHLFSFDGACPVLNPFPGLVLDQAKSNNHEGVDAGCP